MAETKTKAKKAKSKPKSKGSSKAAQSTKAAAKSSSPKAKSSSSKAKSGASSAKSGAKSAAASSNGHSTNGHGSADSVKEAVKNGTHAVGPVAKKAALPLLATGAAAAGAAAVLVGKNGHKQRKVLGVKLPKGSKSHVHMPKVSMPKMSMPKGKGLKGDVRKAAGAVTDAAEKADLIGKRISQVANSVQAVGHATDDAVKKS
jgi:hypothetical protein